MFAGIVVGALAVVVAGVLVVVFWPKPSTKSEIASLISDENDPVGRIPEAPGAENDVPSCEQTKVPKGDMSVHHSLVLTRQMVDN